ncbi:MAG TPA: ATPase [Casimicrobiaceae bacterium]|nr:ATPase [Casimicrobiaceae bacterium]
MIRPQPARWFEILVARDDVARVLEALAATRAAELEPGATAGLPVTLSELAPLLARFGEFALRYERYWPARLPRPNALLEPPAATLARCLATLREWSADAEPLVAMLQRNDDERAQLFLWKRLLVEMSGSAIDLSLAAAVGPPVSVRVLVCAPGAEPAMPPGMLVRRFLIEGAVHALVIGSEAELRTLGQQAAALKGTLHEVPAWMRADARESLAHVGSRLAALDRDDARAHAELAALHAKHGLAFALGDAERLHWVIANVHALESDDLFCRVTGWTSELAGDRLEDALERCGARAILHYPAPPGGSPAPLVLANPAWARPFEVFSRALGMPARNEADPTTLLAVVVPLMFGYMFGDLGQGLVVAAAGFTLRARFPIARLFIAGGLAAAVFGVLFGSVFSMQGVIEPLWIDPLADPLTVLLVPLAGGAVLLTAGLLLSAIEAHWRGELGAWLAGDLWLATLYVALVVAPLAPRALYVAVAAAAAFCAGRAVSARKALAALAAAGEMVERTLQILVNTLSFARVGAFALAHAGLSSAIVALMDAAGGTVAKALVLVAGNVIVLVLEGMVVSIQTTRLVLFEFFARFLVAPGRVFRPLPAPPLFAQES